MYIERLSFDKVVIIFMAWVIIFPQGIVVKVVHKKLGERYHRLKGVVEEVRDLYTGIIKMLDTGDKLKIDQAYLETVIPNIGNGSGLAYSVKKSGCRVSWWFSYFPFNIG